MNKYFVHGNGKESYWMNPQHHLACGDIVFMSKDNIYVVTDIDMWAKTLILYNLINQQIIYTYHKNFIVLVNEILPSKENMLGLPEPYEPVV